MNLKNKKKKGFTLIELMAVIAIIAILAAVLVPTVTGYIERSKKTAILTQARNVVSAVESYNATAEYKDQLLVTKVGSNAPTAGENPSVEKVQEVVGEDLLSDNSISKLGTTVTLKVLQDINKDTNSIKYITIDSSGVITGYTKEGNVWPAGK